MKLGAAAHSRPAHLYQIRKALFWILLYLNMTSVPSAAMQMLFLTITIPIQHNFLVICIAGVYKCWIA